MVAELDGSGLPTGTKTVIDTAGYAWDAWYDPATLTLYVADGRNGLLMYQQEGTTGLTGTSPTRASLHKESPTPKGVSKQIAATPQQLPKVPAAQSHAGLPTCQVNKVVDSPSGGTLRYCIENIATGGTITFSTSVFPKSAPGRITLTSQLPPLTAGSVILDASNAGVILDTNGQDTAFTVMSSYNQVMGLQVTNFRYTGIKVENLTSGNIIGGNQFKNQGNIIYGHAALPDGVADISQGITLQGEGNKVLGNWIGIRPEGTPDGFHWGIMVTDWSKGAIIGGTGPGEGNLISGNHDMGMDIFGFETRVVGNWFGLAPDGMDSLVELGDNPWEAPDTQHVGITLESTAVGNIIGGNTPAERNIISGNRTGVVLSDPSTMQNQVIGNWFGMDKNGNATIGNITESILVWNVTYNKVGGLNPGEANVIAIWGGKGIEMAGQDVHHNLLWGNIFRLIESDYMDDTRKGIDFRDEFRTSVVGNTFDGMPIGIQSNGAGLTQNIIKGNTFRAGLVGVNFENRASQTTVLGNRFDQMDTGIQVISGAHTIIVRDNTFFHGNVGVLADDQAMRVQVLRNTFSSTTSPIETQAGDAPAPPTMLTATTTGVTGSTEPDTQVEVYVVRPGSYYRPLGWVAPDGSGIFSLADNLWWGPQISALATRPDGSTSGFGNVLPVTGMSEIEELFLPILWR
jgi:hypothetical protein